MARARFLVGLWLPVLVWMALIFVASADTESGYRGSRILAPIIRWFVPEISAGDLERCVLWARKGVHFATFAALAALVFRALAGQAVHDRLGRIAIRAWAVATVYAASDELHQTFVPSRVGSITDVLIDAAGAATAVAVLARLRPRRPES